MYLFVFVSSALALHTLFKTPPPTLFTIYQPYYEGRDESHGEQHVRQVCQNVDAIVAGRTDVNLLVLRAAALFHDATDHKYVPDHDEVQAINARIARDLRDVGLDKIEIDEVFDIVAKVSFSKEKKWRQAHGAVPEHSLHRNIVSDADKIEALGLEGLRRMIQYAEHHHPGSTVDQHVDHVRTHCAEKLFKLVSDGYIRTPEGIEIAEHHLDEMRKVVDSDADLRAFIRVTLA